MCVNQNQNPFDFLQTLPPAESSTSLLPITTSTPVGLSVSLFEYKTTASSATIGEEEGPNRTWPFDRTNVANQRQNPSASEGRRSLLDLNSWDERFPLNAEHTPVWAIGLAIVVTVVSLGLLLTFLATFLCYRRYRQTLPCGHKTLNFQVPNAFSGNQRAKEDANPARIQSKLTMKMVELSITTQ